MKSAFLSRACCLCLASIQEFTDHTCLVDLQLAVDGQQGAFPHTLDKLWHSFCRLSMRLFNSASGETLLEMVELTHHLKDVITSADLRKLLSRVMMFAFLMLTVRENLACESSEAAYESLESLFCQGSGQQHRQRSISLISTSQTLVVARNRVMLNSFATLRSGSIDVRASLLYVAVDLLWLERHLDANK